MKSKLKKHRKALSTTFLLVVMSIVLIKCNTGGIWLKSVDYPESLVAGETITMTLEYSGNPIEARTNNRLILGFLAPVSWNAAQNTTISYTSNYGDGTMSLVSSSAEAPYSGGMTWAEAIRDHPEGAGIGDNLLETVEWVVFQTDEGYSFENNDFLDATIELTTRVGDRNMLAILGFFTANDIDGMRESFDNFTYGLTRDVLFTECIEVSEGIGNIIDYCNPQLSPVSPTLALGNDLITISYQGDVETNVLENSDPIYLCATGYTDNEMAYEVCENGDKTRMTRISAVLNNWELTFWPRDYFNIGENETLVRVEYTLINEDGSIELINEGLSSPFIYNFSCEE